MGILNLFGSNQVDENNQVKEELKFFDDKDRYHKNEIRDRGIKKLGGEISEYTSEDGHEVIKLIFDIYDKKIKCIIIFIKSEVGFYKKDYLFIN